MISRTQINPSLLPADGSTRPVSNCITGALLERLSQQIRYFHMVANHARIRPCPRLRLTRVPPRSSTAFESFSPIYARNYFETAMTTASINIKGLVFLVADANPYFSRIVI